MDSVPQVCLTRLEQSRRITPPILLAINILVQSRMLLTFLVMEAHCYLLFNLSTRHLRSFSENLLYSSLTPGLCQGQDYSSTGTGIPLHFLFFFQLHFSLPVSLDCQVPPKWQHNLLVYQTSFPFFNHLQTC